MLGMGIVAIMAIGGLGCMAAGIPGGQQIVLAIIGFLAGYGVTENARDSSSWLWRKISSLDAPLPIRSDAPTAYLMFVGCRRVRSSCARVWGSSR